MKEMKQRRKKERTWAEAARLVLENYSDAPMTPKQILQVIEAEGLKEMRSGTSPLACLNAMLHSNSRGGDGLFYKLPGRISLFTLKKDALQWSRNLSVQEGEELEDAADAESCESNEASTVSGDNDVSLDETSSNASCSAESQSKGLSTARESYRAASQTGKQKKKTGVMLPRVVLTPLKVNGAHMESASGFTGRHVDGESSSTSSSSSSSLALCGATVRSRTEINRDPPQLLRGIRKPTAGQMKRNRGEDIDFETPGSILVNTNLRALINSRTFNVLPAHFQQQLLCLLPEVDRQVGADGLMRLSGSALNNEFFTHAAQSWRERLADGEFTHEMQVRIRQEMEKEKRVEQWKEKFFEDYYGQKLGLTREESQQQNSVQDAENRTGLSVQGEASRPLRGPSTRQRDGHFKKRSRTDLRCRARRSLYKIREPEQTETTKETASVAPDSSFHREMKADVDLKEDLTGSSSASLKPESSGLLVSPEASRLHSKLEDLSLAAASVNRIPSLPQENSARESKDQKRKCFEETASASFPEKKPRLDDRQSFRNTIESVHPEKPQPTKEEPKVPPIRIQLSRIKPPWVVKGQPAYQICPRIIPNTEPSSRGRTGARTLADIKARALQARAQREAATAIGGGGGPGGGGGSSTDKGGGDSSSHTEHRRSKRTHGKCSSNLQRTQLLPPPPLEGEEANSEVAVQVANAHPSRPAKPDACAPNGEGGCLLECAADAVSGGAQLTAGSAKLPRSSPVTGSSFDTATSEEQEDNSEPLLQDIRAESLCNQQECMVPHENSFSCSQAQGSVVSLVGESSIVSGHKDGSAPTELNCNPAGKEILPVQSFLTPEPSPEGKEQQEPDTEARFNGSDPSTGDGATKCENSKMNAVGMENMGPGLSVFTHLPAERLNESEIQNRGEQRRGSLVKPFSHDGLPCQDGIDISEGLPQLWEKPPGADMKNACQQMREIQELKTNGDDETQSMHSETTETASDFEADLTDENAEIEICFKNTNQEEATGKDSSKQSQAGRFNRTGSESAMKSDSLSYVVDLPSVTVVSNASQPQRWVPHTPLTQTPEIQKKLPAPTRPVSSVEANNPLVMQLLKGNLSLEKVLPVSHASIQIEITEPHLDRSLENHSLQMERSSSSYFDQDSSQDVEISTGALSRSGDFYSRRSLGGPQKKQGNSGTALPRTEAIETPSDIPETHPKVGLNLNSQDHLGSLVRGSQKPEELGPRERKASSCSLENQKELPQVHSVPQHNPLTNVVTNKSPEKLNPPAALRFLSPNITTLSPNQNGGTSVNKHYVGVQGKKLFGSGFPCNSPSRLHHPRALEHIPALGTLSPSKQMLPNKSCAPGEGVPTAREEWPSKQPASTLGGIKNENVLACGDPAKSNMENRKDAAPNPAELMEHLQSVPLVMDLPFFKLPREPGKGLNQPLEPSSIPSQLNIKQAFYGKLSKFQLNSTSFNFSSNAPAFPRGLAGSMMQLTHKANFAANHNASLSVQMFADSSSVEEISLKCSCSLKAMIMCKGCGAFCHDDCIGPSKLCVLCLVVR